MPKYRHIPTGLVREFTEEKFARLAHYGFYEPVIEEKKVVEKRVAKKAK